MPRLRGVHGELLLPSLERYWISNSYDSARAESEELIVDHVILTMHGEVVAFTEILTGGSGGAGGK